MLLQAFCFTLFSASQIYALSPSETRLSRLETLLYEGMTEANAALFLLADDCNKRDNTSISAQWIRLAYHDMATHDVDDGTGGLDMSIAFELDRPQNVGVGMRESLSDFSQFVSPYISMSDVIAMGVVHAVAACGGPLIPYRAGRIDARVPGPATVPEPQQDLATHIEMFRKQGFTQSEMIKLVACGHTLGGVRNPDFPTIVSTPDTLVEFDSTEVFDNVVITGYLNGTTRNPLVVAENVTMRSDQRIFSSDQNKTMQSISSPEAFSSACTELLRRMTDTVPKEVTLSDVIKPIEHKVGQPIMGVNSNDTITVLTRLRLLNVNENPNRVVTMFWKEAHSPTCTADTCSSASLREDKLSTPMFDAVGASPSKFFFVPAINATTSISKFWFEVDEKDGSQPLIIDQGSEIPQDTMFWDRVHSNFTVDSDDLVFFTIVVAVRKDAGPVSRIQIQVLNNNDGSFIPSFEKFDLEHDSSIPDTAHYTFYSTTIPPNATECNGFVGSGEVGGTVYELEYVETSLLLFGVFGL